MIKITDLVDCRDLVNLHKSEVGSISGGSCTYNGWEYSPGSKITVGYTDYKCVDAFLWSQDYWEAV